MQSEEVKEGRERIKEFDRNINNDNNKEPWYKGPIKIILGLFLLLIIIMMVIPYYSIKEDPEPRMNIGLDEINEFIAVNASKSVDGFDKIKEIYDKNDAQIKFAANMIVSRSCNNENTVCYAKALYYFVRDEIKYVSDPLGKEYIESPKIVLKTGTADCESGSLLLLNMMENIGVDGEIVLIPGHAFVRIKLDKALGKYKYDDWIYLDWTCGSCSFGEIAYGNMDKEMRFLEI